MIDSEVMLVEPGSVGGESIGSDPPGEVATDDALLCEGAPGGMATRLRRCGADGGTRGQHRGGPDEVRAPPEALGLRILAVATRWSRAGLLDQVEKSDLSVDSDALPAGGVV